MYEKRTQAPLPHGSFAVRVAQHLLGVLALIVVSLSAGMWGYMHFEHLSLVDAFLDAAMLLGGMGPVHVPVTAGGKIFAGLYALYAGLAFIVTTALVLSPVAHRLLHKFHWDAKL
jgi:hypothetical protein